MIDQDAIAAITTRYHDGEWPEFNATQAVFDVGLLLGHIHHQAERIDVQENQIATLSVAVDRWREAAEIEHERVKTLEATLRVLDSSPKDMLEFCNAHGLEVMAPEPVPDTWRRSIIRAALG